MNAARGARNGAGVTPRAALHPSCYPRQAMLLPLRLPRSRSLAAHGRGAYALLAAALALGSAGCSAVSGEHEAETKFPVKPGGDPTFKAWSEITITEDPKSVTSADLMYVRLEAMDSSVEDLGFIRSIYGQVKVGEQLTPVVEKTSFPRGERIVPLDVIYKDDLREFFYEDPEADGYTIHIVWNGEVDTSYPLPADGLWIKVKVAVRIEE